MRKPSQLPFKNLTDISPDEDELISVLRDGIAWGATYGALIGRDQWEETIASMIEQRILCRRRKDKEATCGDRT